jgi:hypothetical protein
MENSWVLDEKASTTNNHITEDANSSNSKVKPLDARPQSSEATSKTSWMMPTYVILTLQILIGTAIAIAFLEIPGHDSLYYMLLKVGGLGLLWSFVL